MAGTGGGLASKLSGLFSGGGGNPIGLSIGSSSIKLVELKKTGKGHKLLHFGISQLPEDAIVNREIVNHIAVVEMTKNLVDQIKLRNKPACISLSGTSVIIKRMQVQVQNMKELQDQVFWEAEQYLPFDVSEVVMDFQLLSKAKDSAADVLLVAVKRSVLESYMNAARDAGLIPKVVDVDYFALQNVFEANYPSSPNEAVALIDLGASSTKIMVVQGGVPVFTRDSVLGGRNLTAEIQRHLNVSYQDAETLKIGGGGGGMPQEVLELMRVSAENFATEIKRAIDFYDASSSGAPISYILLTGGSAKIPDISRIIEESTQRPTQLLNPFNSISYDPEMFTPDYINNVGPLAAVPLGLALRMGAR
jgi:type IV pilus assembly protein PilM